MAGGPVEAFRPLNAYAVASAATAAMVPNLIVGLGHAGTPRTALDAVAARSEPTPTSAATLLRNLVERTGIRLPGAPPRSLRTPEGRRHRTLSSEVAGHSGRVPWRGVAR